MPYHLLKALAQGLWVQCCFSGCVKKQQRSTKLSHSAIVCVNTESWRREVFILCLHSKNGYATQMQSRDDGWRGNEKSTLGELTLVGAQWGANLECDVLANTLPKHQLRLPSGKLRQRLLGTFQPCLKANHSSFGSNTVAPVLLFLCMCTTKHTTWEPLL